MEQEKTKLPLTDPVSLCLTRQVLKKARTDDLRTARHRIGQMATRTGLLINILLATGKIISGLLMASLSVFGDGINNLSDALASLLSLVGFYLAAKPADKEHPYGHARVEYLFSALVAGLVFYAGSRILISAVRKILNPGLPEQISVLALVFLVLSIALKFWLWRFYGGLAKLLSSELLRGAAADSLGDILASSAILAALPISQLLNFNLDGYFGVLVAFFVIRAAWDVLHGTVNKILGGQPSPELVQQLDAFLKKQPAVMGFHDLRIHEYGSGRCFASVDIEVDGSRDVMELHDAIDAIERQVQEEFNLQLTAHMDPIRQDDDIRNAMKASLDRILPEIAPGLRYHDLTIFELSRRPNCMLDLLIPLGEEKSDQTIAEELTERLKAEVHSCYPLIRPERNYLDLL